MDLKNKIVLVTGGTSGIGLAIAKMAKEKGASVIVNARDEEKIEKVKAEFGFDAYKCDVSKEEDVLSLFSEIRKKYNKLDVLVNNAGFGNFAKLTEIDSKEFKDVHSTNVFGAMLMAREAAKIFQSQHSGNIVNISSTAGTKGFGGGSAYVASKFALKGMTECWRAELRPYNVRVMLVNPSEVQTEFASRSRGERRAYNPSKLHSEDIAHSVITALEMDDRGFIPELTVFATNPKD